MRLTWACSVTVRMLLVTVLIYSGMSATMYASLCVPMVTYWMGAYHQHVIALQRGMSSQTTRVYFSALLEFILIKLEARPVKPATPLKRECLKFPEVVEINNFLQQNSPRTYIHKSYEKYLNPFYLPKSAYSDNIIQTTSSQQQSKIENTWNVIEKGMAASIASVDVKELSSLPSAVSLFFEPEEDSVRHDHLARMGEGNIFSVQAQSLLDDVLAIVARLALLKAGEEHALQILVHAAANIFTAIRATRLEGNALNASDVYLGLYRTRFNELTKGMNIEAVPEIPPNLIREHVTVHVSRLLSFYGFRATEYAQAQTNGNVVSKKIADIIFSPAVLQPLREALSVQSTRIVDDRNSSKVDRQGHIPCPSGFHPYPAGPTPSSQCCSYMCLLLTPEVLLGGFAVEDCCIGCNFGSCPTSGVNSSVERAITIQNLPFGIWDLHLIRVEI